MLSGSLDRETRAGSRAVSLDCPGPGREASPHLPLSLCSFPQPQLSEAPASLSHQPLQGWCGRQGGGHPQALSPGPLPAPSPLEGWSEEEAQTVEPATPGGNPGQQLPPSPLPTAQSPTLTENSTGAGTWPPHRRRRAGWTGTSSSTDRGQLTLREERTRGWVGSLPPSPLASVLKHKGQKEPRTTTRGHPRVLAGHRLPPSPPFILPFLGVEIETQGWGQPGLRPSQSHQL